MARKVIIDCDPGIDDAIALCLALFEPRLEVVAVTSVAGTVSAEQSTKNVQSIVERLDPPRYPRIGVATAPDDFPPVDGRELNGEDGLANSGFVCSQHHHQHLAEKIICDEVRAAPDQVTIICLGPLTNIARAFQRDPGLPSLIGRIVMLGGSLHFNGNVTPAAEFNMYFDPASARSVFRAPTTKTLVPLDVTRQLPLTMNFLNQLPSEATRVGDFVRKLLSFSFRAYHQRLGHESILLNEVVALLAAINPELFHVHEMYGDIETAGELTQGATIFDRRHKSSARPNLEVATELDATAAMDCLIRGLHQAARST